MVDHGRPSHHVLLLWAPVGGGSTGGLEGQARRDYGASGPQNGTYHPVTPKGFHSRGGNRRDAADSIEHVRYFHSGNLASTGSGFMCHGRGCLIPG